MHTKKEGFVMKKFLPLFLVAVMSISICACGNNASADEETKQETTVSETDEKDNTETAAPDDETFATELVSETWYNVSFVNNQTVSGGRMYFNEDGTGHFKNWDNVIDFQWEVKDSCMMMKYEDNGVTVEDKYPLFLNQDRYEMTDESGTFVYLKESDATMKLSNAFVGSEIELGTYEQDNVAEDGTEPIKWIVADKSAIDGYVILVSYYGLDVQQYHNEDVDITWENCSLRKWLNEDFYNTAFSDEEKAIISPISLENPANKSSGIEGGNPTVDTVWMFGEYDARNYMELMSKDNGQVPTTDYVQSLGEKEIDCFWLRTPGSAANKASVAWDDSNFGEINSPVTESHVVRPVILVSKDADVFISFHYEKNVIKHTGKTAPMIGMTADEVRDSVWGSPEKINSTETAYGTREQWVYPDRGYVYLKDGVVTSIQHRD